MEFDRFISKTKPRKYDEDEEAAQRGERNMFKGFIGTKRCKVCGMTDHLGKCAGCENAYYCSESCQRADWPEHKLVCK